MNALTPLPAGAPPAYRPVGGPKTIAWMKAKGWIDRRKVSPHICTYRYENGTKCWCGVIKESNP